MIAKIKDGDSNDDDDDDDDDNEIMKISTSKKSTAPDKTKLGLDSAKEMYMTMIKLIKIMIMVAVNDMLRSSNE